MNGAPAGGSATGGLRQKETAMSGWFRLTLGLLAVVVGAIWTVQGLGYVEGSAMTGQRIWAVIGPALALVGLALLWLGMRARGRR
ncbi:hypothetical protein SAMN05443287_101763 [Micromonospora phaseoli]|uniref:Uncharacterized protein n=1 Tax=Micromonospora phaseoli TaxID=1144548 RepID=A0A1H6SNX7_9ACTN|nr:hypothetical protein CLV64_101763 [Micromonospora phaseoli]SEI68626.1 hypothetical protein SAMN05443287_101763 [Micromonospora phaseoli]